MKLKTICGAGALALTAGCATVTVKQEKPIEINVRVDIYDHAEKVVDDLTKPLFKDKPKSAVEDSRESRVVALAARGGAERSLDEIKNSIRARAETVRAMKTAAAIGEDSRGYLAVVDAKSMEAKRVVEAENADRKALYEKDAASEGRTLKEIEAAYARAWHKKAQAGDWLEQGGKWTRK